MGKLPTIGFLGADASACSPWTAAFVAHLRELGSIEGRTIAIEYRWDDGRPGRDAEVAAEFVRLNVAAADNLRYSRLCPSRSSQALPRWPIRFYAEPSPAIRGYGWEGSTGTLDPGFCDVRLDFALRSERISDLPYVSAYDPGGPELFHDCE